MPFQTSASTPRAPHHRTRDSHGGSLSTALVCTRPSRRNGPSASLKLSLSSQITLIPRQGCEFSAPMCTKRPRVSQYNWTARLQQRRFQQSRPADLWAHALSARERRQIPQCLLFHCDQLRCLQPRSAWPVCAVGLHCMSREPASLEGARSGAMWRNIMAKFIDQHSLR